MTLYCLMLIYKPLLIYDFFLCIYFKAMQSVNKIVIKQIPPPAQKPVINFTLNANHHKEIDNMLKEINNELTFNIKHYLMVLLQAGIEKYTKELEELDKLIKDKSIMHKTNLYDKKLKIESEFNKFINLITFYNIPDFNTEFKPMVTKFITNESKCGIFKKSYDEMNNTEKEMHDKNIKILETNKQNMIQSFNNYLFNYFKGYDIAKIVSEYNYKDEDFGCDDYDDYDK